MFRHLIFSSNFFLKPGDRFIDFLGNHYNLFRWFVAVTPSSFISYWAMCRAWRAYRHAIKTVPAYRKFAKGFSGANNFSEIPETDKDNYIRKWPTEERCKRGKIPAGTVVDESSGSSGTPYNWVRSTQERHVSHMLVSLFARYCFPHKRIFTINAFSMGSWATGLNMGIALQNNGLVKNIGPDADKIFDTLAFWGSGYNYILCGYPPFLKYLVDASREMNFPLENYLLFGLVGGEGMSEGLRDYLLPYFRKVYSGYGATDLEIGIAGETPLSVAIRRESRTNEKLRRALFGDDPRLPMVFQYNPLMHEVEVNDKKELVFTISRLNVLSPRIRYNIHDEGGVMSFENLVGICHASGFDIKAMLASESECTPRLPFIWVYGRSDSPISLMGANIYPEDIEQCLYEEDELARITRSFCIGLYEDGGEARPEFSFEVTCEITDELADLFREKIPARLATFNKDFNEAMHEHAGTLVPVIKLYPEGTGIFAKDKGR